MLAGESSGGGDFGGLSRRLRRGHAGDAAPRRRGRSRCRAAAQAHPASCGKLNAGRDRAQRAARPRRPVCSYRALVHWPGPRVRGVWGSDSPKAGAESPIHPIIRLN
jgi:hypothetical protein